MINEFSNVANVKIISNTLQETRSWLYEAGRRFEEAFVLWAGVYVSDIEFIITTAIYPEQRCIRSLHGLAVYVSGEELFKINKWLYDNKVILLAQVHSHPTQAFHSDTDDHFPMVNAIGQFSVVVPNFAKASSIELSRCAIYRLNNNNKWIELSRNNVSKIFEVIKDGSC